MSSKLSTVSCCCFSTLRQLCNIRRQVPTAVFQSPVIVLVLGQLDYCNSVLAGVPANLIRRLQSVQNAAARLISGIRHSEHITDALTSLHWLCVPEHILFKVAVLSYTEQWMAVRPRICRPTSPASLMCHLDWDSDHLTLTKWLCCNSRSMTHHWAGGSRQRRTAAGHCCKTSSKQPSMGIMSGENSRGGFPLPSSRFLLSSILLLNSRLQLQ